MKPRVLNLLFLVVGVIGLAARGAMGLILAWLCL
jgi:hypothetical protein